MGKNVNISAYVKPPTKKGLKKGLIQIIAIGLIWFLVLILPWFFWLKPYKEFGHYEADAIYGKNIFVIGTHEEKIIYEIEGIQYEKILKSSRTYYVHNTTKLDFYYEKDNPNYTINGRTTSLIVLPCVASAGFLLCGYGIWQYRKKMKLINENELSSV